MPTATALMTQIRLLGDFLSGLITDAWRSFTGLRPAPQILVVLALAGVVYLVVYVPLPTTAQLRDWATSGGWVFYLLCGVTYILLTQFPIPRTIFTVTAGVLFGPLWGIVLSCVATTTAAVLAFWWVRALGGTWMAPRLDHPAVAESNRRLHARGWLAVGSLRMIPVVPFSICNYVCALSSLRLRDFFLGTAVGIIPTTAAGVLLGDGLTGQTNPAMLAASAALFSVGLIGLAVDYYTHPTRRAQKQAPAHAETAEA